MESFCIIGVVLLLSIAELEAATSISEFSCPKRNLTVTVDDILRLYIDGVEITDLPNSEFHDVPDVVNLPCTTRLIGIHGSNGPDGAVAGIVASTDDNYVLTNSSWKCSNVSYPGWAEVDFDDSAWESALEFGNNGGNGWVHIPAISSDAEWIWLRQYYSDWELMDSNVYCRKRLEPGYCTSSPCLFGGTCIDEPNGGYCICPPGYTGQNCSEFNYCESSPCGSGGSCLPLGNGYVCQCHPGYTGDHCQDMINNCASVPCLNGGTCLNGINYYVCVCSPEWTGVSCETIIDACNPNPCLNGGTCNNRGSDSFTCTCPIYLTGVKCESPNYQEAYACGTTLTWSQYNASNGFTRLCQYWTPSEDIDGRNTECRHTINDIPLYFNYTGLLNAGGNFGCIVSQNYPEDLPAASNVACADNYQQDVSLGSYAESALLIVCIRYPYEGIPG